MLKTIILNTAAKYRCNYFFVFLLYVRTRYLTIVYVLLNLTTFINFFQLNNVQKANFSTEGIFCGRIIEHL